MPDLAFLIPARNEQFLKPTVDDLLAKMRGDSEIIVIADGQWPIEPLPLDPRLTIVYHPQSIGQRAATNEAARITKARYVCKIDAHCSVAEGFDVEVVQAGERLGKLATQIPRMYNLHAFDWVCQVCQTRHYQGRVPDACKCGQLDWRQELVWQPRWNRMTDFARFDSDLHFQYWAAYASRPEASGDYPEVMSSVGACFVMRRDRFFDIGGVDEKHGSWGQFGTEIACKSWLSGGLQVTNRRTWFAHMFRTQQGFSFPYPMSGKDQDAARAYSKDLWLGNRWKKAVHTVQWLVDKFAPVPGWEPTPTRGAVYYSDCRPSPSILDPVKTQIQYGMRGAEIVSVTLGPCNFGTKQIHLEQERGALTMFEQILAGLEASTAEVVFLTEHDVLYHASHFEFVPPRMDTYYYNEHTYKLNTETGEAVFYYTKQTSGLCASRTLLLAHYRARVERVRREGFTRAMGFEPGTHRTPRGVDDVPAERWMSPFPNVDLRHPGNFTQSRWDPSQFRTPPEGWKQVDEIPGWGRTRGRVAEFLAALNP